MRNITSVRVLSVVVVVLLIANIVLLVLLWKEKGKHEQRRQQPTMFDIMVHELNMSDQQKNDYQKLREEYLNSVRPVFDSIREVRKKFVHIIQDSIINDSIMEEYSSRIAQKQRVADRLTFGYFRRVRALFINEQQKKYDSLLEKTMLQRINGGNRRDSANKK